MTFSDLILNAANFSPNCIRVVAKALTCASFTVLSTTVISQFQNTTLSCLPNAAYCTVGLAWSYTLLAMAGTVYAIDLIVKLLAAKFISGFDIIKSPHAQFTITEQINNFVYLLRSGLSLLPLIYIGLNAVSIPMTTLPYKDFYQYILIRPFLYTVMAEMLIPEVGFKTNIQTPTDARQKPFHQSFICTNLLANALNYAAKVSLLSGFILYANLFLNPTQPILNIYENPIKTAVTSVVAAAALYCFDFLCKAFYILTQACQGSLSAKAHLFYLVPLVQTIATCLLAHMADSAAEDNPKFNAAWARQLLQLCWARVLY